MNDYVFVLHWKYYDESGSGIIGVYANTTTANHVKKSIEIFEIGVDLKIEKMFIYDIVNCDIDEENEYNE